MDLKKYIRSIPDYPKKGILFRDITTLIKNPEAFNFSVDKIIEISKKIKFDKVAAIESRGFIFASTIGYKLGCDVIMIRKKGKLPGKTIHHSYKLEYGEDCLEIQKRENLKNKNVILIDDLLATGGTAGAAVELLQKVKANVSVFLTLIELTNLKGRNKIKVKTDSLISFDE